MSIVLIKAKHMGIEEGGYRPPEEPERPYTKEHRRELLKLLDEYEAAEQDIEVNGNLTVEVLDRFFRVGGAWKRADVRFTRWEYGNRLEEYIEHLGEDAVKITAAEQGTYAREKADYCIKRGLARKDLADGLAQDMKLSAEDRERGAQEFRNKAKNWLRMAAICLETPEKS